MVASLTYRTANLALWGGGNGSDLTATQVDTNFWTLYEAIVELQNNPNGFAGIDYIAQTGGNLLYIHLTDHRVLGPYTLPTAEWNPRGQWEPDTLYAPFDVVSDDGSLYIVNVSHTSGTTFSVLSTDGEGHALYTLILSSPTNVLPENGSPGQRLVKQAGSPLTTAWEYDLIRLALYIEGQPTPGEQLIQYCVTDNITFPAGLAGSVIFQETETVSFVQYTLAKNGNPIGSINFLISPAGEITVSFPTAVTCVPGDIITMLAPGTPDTSQANISFSLVAQLTD
jgi:hypothetical protein